jgi:asparagine synthase (glutamine-hydrolysing)
MCGIAGIFAREGLAGRSDPIAMMTAAIAHRGPDGDGFWRDDFVALGHRRLAIRDLGEAGRQPMSDPAQRVIITYNGEIYNFETLRRQVERETGYVFRSNCDAEIFIAGYLAWGEAVFERVEGMFAIGLWDTERQVLLLARDAAGVKPLYFLDEDERFLFGSEPKAILAGLAGRPSLDAGSLHAFLAQGYVAPDRGLLEGLRQVAPGSIRTVSRSGTMERRFWRPSRHPEITRMSDAVAAFSEVWKKVLPSQLVSDVPLGVLQSGGIDSALVTLGLAGLGDIPLFCARFRESSHDEWSLASATATAAQRRLHGVPVDEEASASDVFLAVTRHSDGHIADASAYPTYQLCASVRQHVKVVLGGDGGDEFFGGYPTYRASWLAGQLGPWLPGRPLRAMGRWSAGLGATSETRLPLPETLSRLLSGMAEGSDAHAHWRRLVPGAALDDLYGPALKPLADSVDPLAGYIAAIHDAGGPGDLDRFLIADQTFYLPADLLMKVDSMSMAHGLEVRVPFLDRRVMDLASRIDARLLSPIAGPGKKVLREALRAAGGPAAVIDGAKKGFNLPVARLLRHDLAALGDQLLDRDVDRLQPWLNPVAVRRMWRAHRTRQANHAYALWALLTFAAWKGMAGLQ